MAVSLTAILGKSPEDGEKEEEGRAEKENVSGGNDLTDLNEHIFCGLVGKGTFARWIFQTI